MTKCSFRTATQEDALEFFGELPPFSFKGIVAVEDGKVIGIGGISRTGGVLTAFSDMKPEMRKYKREMVMTCRMIVAMIKQQDRPVYAVANNSEPTSLSLLVRLGFKPAGKITEDGEVMRWAGD